MVVVRHYCVYASATLLLWNTSTVDVRCCQVHIFDHCPQHVLRCFLKDKLHSSIFIKKIMILEYFLNGHNFGLILNIELAL